MYPVRIAAILIVAAVLSHGGAQLVLAIDRQKHDYPLLKINQALDRRTVIKPSAIPHGGNGLYALVAIKKGEVIGELGGRLLPKDKYPEGNHYIAALLECAQKQAYPYAYLDAKDYGAHVSRINFAPSKINGIETHLQNAAIRRLCQAPYFEFYALRDIAPGEEMFSSYGPNYDYSRFMYQAEVKEFFCKRAKIDCRAKYSFDF